MSVIVLEQDMDSLPKIRLSRPTNHLEAMLEFYGNGLGFEVLDRMDNQQGWDGVIFGHRDWPYQFEFTSRRDGSVVPPAPTAEHFIVFCIPPDFVSLKTAMACATRERAILNFTSRSANRSKVFHTEFSPQRALFLEPARRL